MKKIFIALIGLATMLSVSAATQYEVVTGARGGANGSINILANMSSFSFTTDFGSVGNAGQISYYVYTDTVENAVYNDASFSKGTGSSIDLGTLSAGDKVGFYLTRNNGDVLTDFYFEQDGDVLSLKFTKNSGNGNDEYLAILEFVAPNPGGGGGNGGGAAGQPLPGALVALAIGGAVVAASRRKAAKK